MIEKIMIPFINPTSVLSEIIEKKTIRISTQIINIKETYLELNLPKRLIIAYNGQ